MDGVPVPSEFVTAFVAMARTMLEGLGPPEPVRPAFFELTLALALSKFARAGAAWGVFEAGIGGATDATAALEPGVRLVVLTNVDLDHMSTIGPSLHEIAMEKAGAFAGGVPAVTAAAGVGLAVARKVASERGCVLTEVAPVSPGEAPRAANERLAAAALRLLDVPEPAIAQALLRPALPGRGEVFEAGGRHVILDGAHDPAAASQLASRLAGEYVLLFGALGRKQGEATLAVLEARAKRVVITEAAEGEGTAHLAGPGRELVAEPGAALERALSLAPVGGLVVVAGSLYLAGRMRPLLNSMAHGTPSHAA